MNGLKGSGSSLNAMCGGPPCGGPIRSPFWLRIAIVGSPIAPAALATPGTERTRSSSDAFSAAPDWAPNWSSTAERGRTVTSVRW